MGRRGQTERETERLRKTEKMAQGARQIPVPLTLAVCP